jgi:hypothetical protein
MKKLLLLDADVVIDLHSLGFFEKMSRSYNLLVTRKVFEEAKFYRKRNQKIPTLYRADRGSASKNSIITSPASRGQRWG